jgi:hypothetical protein
MGKLVWQGLVPVTPSRPEAEVSTHTIDSADCRVTVHLWGLGELQNTQLSELVFTTLKTTSNVSRGHTKVGHCYFL